MSLRIHILQHVDFEGPGAILDWAKQRNASVQYTRQWLGESLPDMTQFDLLIILGGPMGVHDTQEFAWMAPEIAWVEKVLHAQKSVLGICLGAQVISKALGGTITKNHCKEIGYFPLSSSQTSASPWHAVFADTITPLHWHGETFTIPQGALPLAESDACKNQAFVWGKNQRALALQFHLEATEDSLAQLLQHASADLESAGSYVQPKSEILAKSKQYGEPLRTKLAECLNLLCP